MIEGGLGGRIIKLGVVEGVRWSVGVDRTLPICGFSAWDFPHGIFRTRFSARDFPRGIFRSGISACYCFAH